jgi:MoxR-like ATPase
MQTLRGELALVANDAEANETPDVGIENARTRLAQAITAANRIVVDKPRQIRMTFACLLAGGHLLIEDLPGTGKTVLARTMGAILGLTFQRIQFTSDLMPSDILGVSIYKQSTNSFELHKGPVFTHLLLADEINRASPRTQSALLEAMAEGHVSIDRQTIALPQPFMVIATQNPRDMAGTFPLPEAQRDRFLFQIDMGYPDRKAELALMRGERRNDMIEEVKPILLADDILALRHMAMQCKTSDSLVDYAYELVAKTRNHPAISVGLSPRASIALIDAAKAMAFIEGRAYVIPEDVQAAFVPLAGHRVRSADGSSRNSDAALRDIVAGTSMS